MWDSNPQPQDVGFWKKRTMKNERTESRSLARYHCANSAYLMLVHLQLKLDPLLQQQPKDGASEIIKSL